MSAWAKSSAPSASISPAIRSMATKSALKRLGAVTYAALQEDRRRSGFRAVLAGTLIRKQERRGRNDQPYGFLSLSDPTGMFEVMVFSEVLVASRPLLEAGKSILLTCRAPTGSTTN